MLFKAPSVIEPKRMMRLAHQLKSEKAEWASNKNPDVFPPKTVDEIIDLLLRGDYQAVTILDWLHLLDSKDDWDAEHSKQEIADSSVSIFNAALQDASVLQLLLFRASITLDGQINKFPSVLFSHLHLLKGKLSDHWAVMLQTVISARDDDFITIARTCRHNLLVPEEFFDQLGLPLCTNLKEKTVRSLKLTIEECNGAELAQWITVLLRDIPEYEHFNIASAALSNPNAKYLHEHAHIVEWFDKNCHPHSKTGYWGRLESSAREILGDLIDIADYGQIRRLAHALRSLTVSKALGLQEWEENHIQQRSLFWSHYSDKMLSIRITVPESTHTLLTRTADETGFRPRRLEKLLPSKLAPEDEEVELIIIEFKTYLFIEVLRGGNGILRCFENTSTNRTILLEESFSMRKLLEMRVFEYHDHEFCWQNSAEEWLRATLGITPNDHVKKFVGLPPDKSIYDPKTGLPPLGDLETKERERKLGFWRKKIIAEIGRYSTNH